ncbi:CHRD domain-containing protein [Sinomonas sp. JGH33]|uniref:CHRD domain-containing protein n=1 Tax=Sinomonas terricola TaxID=3110330 RepID=A0ABU5T998_9MICC|nr:CHRD domain-containing protein [Sinomonas sp. JGH33]MEA5456273.1 CHRD domain-containing protein [Sinomonas sp. JGH33]
MSRRISRWKAVAAAVAALTLTSIPAALANPGGVPAIPLNSEQETTGSTSPASGFFTYTINGTEFCYTLQVRDLTEPAIGAHVHVAPRNVPGPIVIPLTPGSGTSWSVSACTTASADLLSAISADPDAYYVNVHTHMWPGGEIRGQLK